MAIPFKHPNCGWYHLHGAFKKVMFRIPTLHMEFASACFTSCDRILGEWFPLKGFFMIEIWLSGARKHGQTKKKTQCVQPYSWPNKVCGPKMMWPCLEAFNNHRSPPITTLPLAGGLFLLGICSLAKGNGFGLFGTSKGASWQKHAGPNCMVNPVDTPLLYV